MTSKFAIAAFAVAALFVQPAVASDDHAKPAEHHAVSKADEAKLAECKKMTSDAAHHDAACVKLMAEHPVEAKTAHK